MARKTSKPAKTWTRSEIDTLARQAGYAKYTLALIDWENGLFRVGIKCGWTDEIVVQAFGREMDIAIRALADNLQLEIATKAAERKAAG